MRPIVTDRVAWSVCHTSEPGKKAKLIEMLFGLWTRVSLGNHVLDGCPNPPWEGAILRGERVTHGKVQGHSAVSCAKMAEPIEMPFGLRARMGPGNRVRWQSTGAHGRCHGNQFWEWQPILGLKLLHDSD